MRFEIDTLFKNRMMAAYDIYELQSKILYVQYSYRKDNFNVYAFSDHFHVGVLRSEGVIHQKVMDIPDSTLNRSYAEMENIVIRNNNNALESIRDSKFKSMHVKVNLAIKEFINRDNVYKQYQDLKKAQLNLTRDITISKIEKQQSEIDRMLNRRLDFHFNSENGERGSFELEIKAYIDRPTLSGRPVFEWTIARTRENLDTILNHSRVIIGDDRNHLELKALLEFIVIVSYYTSQEAFESIFSLRTTVSNEERALNELRTLFTGRQKMADHLRRPFGNSNKIQQEIQTGERTITLDYNMIDDIDHLIMIMDMNDLLVFKHKKYVRTDITDIEQSFFNLQLPLKGSKETKRILSSILRVDDLMERIKTMITANV